MQADKLAIVFFAMKEAMVGYCLNRGVYSNDVSDVIAECWLRVLQGLHSFDESVGDIDRWIMGCLKHSVGDWQRERKREARHTSRYALWMNREIDGTYYARRAQAVEDEILAKIDRDRLKDATEWLLKQLTERQEQLVREHFLADKLWRDVAETNGTTTTAVMQAWLYGRERLRRTIEALIDPEKKMPRRAAGRK